MNKDEAIKYLNEFILFKKISNTTEGEAVECFKSAVEALQEYQHYKDLAESYEKTINKLTKAIAEEQPSEDCISRKAVLDLVADYDLSMGQVVNGIHALPSVTPQPKEEPQPKTGHWTHDGSNWTNRWICSECGYKLYAEQSKYCPKCGAKMQEEKK